MANVDPGDVNGLSGHNVIDNHGEKVGRVADVLFDEGTSTPRWVLVNMGRVLHRQTAVPLLEAYRSADGDLVVAYDKDEVKHAPRLTPNTVLTNIEERHLCQHYGLDTAQPFDSN
jgi:uncharacterized protein YrrD